MASCRRWSTGWSVASSCSTIAVDADAPGGSDTIAVDADAPGGSDTIVVDAERIADIFGVQRGRRVNKIRGPEELQLAERHDASDLD